MAILVYLLIVEFLHHPSSFPSFFFAVKLLGGTSSSSSSRAELKLNSKAKKSRQGSSLSPNNHIVTRQPHKARLGFTMNDISKQVQGLLNPVRLVGNDATMDLALLLQPLSLLACCFPRMPPALEAADPHRLLRITLNLHSGITLF